MSKGEDADRVVAKARLIGVAFLAAEPPEITSAILAELLSLWAASIFPIEAREEMYQNHLALVRDLIPVQSGKLEAIMRAAKKTGAVKVN